MEGKTLLLLLVTTTLYFSCRSTVQTSSEKLSPTPIDTLALSKAQHSLLVAKNGEILLETYSDNRTADNLSDIQSLTKGLVSLLVGIAIEEGVIADEDQPIVDYFLEEFADLNNLAKRKITIKHLLNQTSGLAWKGYPEHAAWLSSYDPIRFVLEKELLAPPGEVYNYNSGATHLLSVIISKATGMNTLEFAQEKLFTPLGIESLHWKRRGRGYYDGSGLGLEMRPGDLMKIGLLLQNKGIWNGQQLVAEEWIGRSFDVDQKMPTDWGLRGSRHGYCWYSARLGNDLVNYGMGYGGQFIIMLPVRQLTIVTTHEHDTPDGIPQQIRFLNHDLPMLIERFGH